MSIEIRNYNPNIATKSLVASFDLIFRNWGLIIREVKLFQKDSRRWISMPNRSVKNGDGSWGQPIPYVEFSNKEMFYKLQDMVLAEIDKMETPKKVESSSIDYYPHPTIQPVKQTQPQQLELPF